MNRYKAAEAQLLDSYSYAKFRAVEEERADVGTAMAQDAAAYRAIPTCLASENMLNQRIWKLFDRLKKLQKKRQRESADNSSDQKSKNLSNLLLHPRNA
jgi:hypothetical protein